MDGLIPDGPLKQRLKEAGKLPQLWVGPHHKGNEEKEVLQLDPGQ